MSSDRFCIYVIQLNDTTNDKKLKLVLIKQYIKQKNYQSLNMHLLTSLFINLFNCKHTSNILQTYVLSNKLTIYDMK